MKKTLRKYQAGSLPSYTGMSTSPTYQIPTSNSTLPTSLPPQSGTVPTTGLAKNRTKSNVGGGIMAGVNAAGGLASSIYGEVEAGNAKISAVKSAQEDRKKYESFAGAQRVNQILYGESGTDNPYTYNAELAGKNNSKIVSNSQQQITKQATMTGLSFLPFGIGSAINMVLDPLWKIPTDESLAGGGGAKNNVGGTSIGAQSDEVFAKYGGRMPVYKMGGSRSYQEPNAELEDGEVIMRNGGGVKMIKGDRHEEGGEDEYLAPGDFVWSDHLKYQGKSMAELYLMVKDNPERVEQLKALQENLASKEKPSKYNDLPQKKYGGELPQYQNGTYRPYQLPTIESTTTSSFPFTRDQFDMFGELPGGGIAMRGIPIQNRVVAQANAAAAAQALQEQKAAKAKASVAAKANAAKLAAAKAANVSPTLMPAISGQQPLPNPPLATLPVQSGPAPTVANVQSSKGRAVGEKSKTEQFLGKYGPSIAAGLGGVGQLFALGLAENPYENLSVPNAAQLSSAQFTALGRNNNEAFTNTAMSGYRALLDDARYRGAGPGDMSQGQIAYNRAMQEIEAAQKGVMASNINLAATEAELNQSNDLEVKKFNAAAAKNAQIENELALNSARASFEGQKPGLIAGAIGTTVSDGLNFYKDLEKAKAIYGNTSLEKDHYGVDMQAINKKAWQVAEEKAKAAGKTATYADYYKEVSGLLDLLPKK